MIKTSSTNNSSYIPYTLIEIDNMIKNFSKQHPPLPEESSLINFTNKLLYIVRDLLIRIEKLEGR